MNLFGGFRQQVLRNKEPIPNEKKKRAIRQEETSTRSQIKSTRVSELNDGVSEVAKRTDHQRRQTLIVKQIMNVSMHIDKFNFEDKFTLTHTLGEGAHAIVKAAFDSKGNRVAVKICRSGDPEIIKTFIETYRICRILNHPSILKCQELYVDEETEQLQLIMEFCGYPSIQKVLKHQKDHILSESTVRNLMKSLLEAVLHMHERGVAHRDLKPDNILMDPTSEGTSIKIIDFGVSAKFKQYQSSHAQLHVVQKDMWTRTGNYLYCAPEIFEGAGYTEKIDMWACGVIMYQCLFGRLPFYEDSIFSTIEAIRMAQVALPDSASKQAKDILRRFLNADPLARVTAESISIWITYQAALQHPWFYSVMKPTKVGVPTSENRLEFHDDQDSPRKQQAYFDRNKFARSNTILITSHSRHKQVEQPILEKELSSEGSPPTKHELKFSVVLSKEDSDSDSASSPLMKISKLNQLIDKEIHIKKKPDQKFGEGFLKSKLAIRLSQMQEDNEQPKSQVFDDVIE